MCKLPSFGEFWRIFFSRSFDKKCVFPQIFDEYPHVFHDPLTKIACFILRSSNQNRVFSVAIWWKLRFFFFPKRFFRGIFGDPLIKLASFCYLLTKCSLFLRCFLIFHRNKLWWQTDYFDLGATGSTKILGISTYTKIVIASLKYDTNIFSSLNVMDAFWVCL